MNCRWFEFLSGLSITTAGTEPIVLKGEDPISALMVQVRVTGVTGDCNNPADNAITRLSVMDGSRTIYNTRGIAGVPLHFNMLGSEPVHFNAYANLIQNIATFIIPFGRYLGDLEYALDPTKFKNPKILIEHNYANGGLGTPSAATIQVYAMMFDEKIPALKGFLKTQEVWSATCVSSASHVVNLPVDAPIKAIAVQSRAKGYSITDQINVLKLSEDNDKHVAFEESTTNLVKLIFPQKPFTENMLGYTNSTTTRLHYGYNCYESYMTPVSTLVATDIYSVVAYGPNVDVKSTTTCEFTGRRVGYCPNGMIWMPMGLPNDPSDWLKPRSDMNLDLKITCGTVLTSSTAEVIVQQEHLY